MAILRESDIANDKCGGESPSALPVPFGSSALVGCMSDRLLPPLRLCFLPVGGELGGGGECVYATAWNVALKTGAAAPSAPRSEPSTFTVPNGSRLQCFPRRNWLFPVCFFTSSMIASSPLPVMFKEEYSSRSSTSVGDDSSSSWRPSPLSLRFRARASARIFPLWGARTEVASTRRAQYENCVFDQPERT